MKLKSILFVFVVLCLTVSVVNSGPTQKPCTNQKPDPTQKPGSIQKPGPTKKPGPVQKPGPTKKPAPIQKPGPNKKPAPIQKPAPIKKPVPVQKPNPIKKPGAKPKQKWLGTSQLKGINVLTVSGSQNNVAAKNSNEVISKSFWDRR